MTILLSYTKINSSEARISGTTRDIFNPETRNESYILLVANIIKKIKKNSQDELTRSDFINFQLNSSLFRVFLM